MRRKVVLSKGAILWEAGDGARTVGVLESGRLGIRTEHGLVGVVSPKSVVGESALYALEDETTVTEYPASSVKQLIESGNDVVGSLVLGTLHRAGASGDVGRTGAIDGTATGPRDMRPSARLRRRAVMEFVKVVRGWGA